MKKELLKISCQSYWWNMGHKTLDINGTAYDFLLSRDIKIRKIRSKINIPIGYKFIIYVSSAKIVLDIYTNLPDACFNAFKLFLSVMGDKATLQVEHRYCKVNWR